MEEKKKIGMGTIISIIAIIIVIVLLGILFSSNSKLKDRNNEINELKGTNKKEIIAEEFKNTISGKGFNVNTIKDVATEEAISYSRIKKAYITQAIEDKEYRINFFEFEDETSGEYMFYKSIQEARNEGNWNITETIEKSMNHAKYTALTNGNYITISRIGNTLIWGTINADKKQELNNLINEFGY